MSEAQIARKMGRRVVVLAPLLPVVTAIGCSPTSGDRRVPTVLSGAKPRPSAATPTPAEKRVLPTVPAVTPAPPRAEPSPIIVKASEITSLTEWNKLSTVARIQLLELKKYPSEANEKKELIKAVAEIYCAKIQCEKTPDQIVQSVSFLNTSDFAKEYIKEQEKTMGRALTDIEKRDVSRNLPIATTAVDKSNIYFNIETFEEKIRVLEKNSQAGIQMGERDLGTVVLKSILFHELSHLNQSDEVFTFDPIPLELPSDHPNAGSGIVLTQLKGNSFAGVGGDGKKYFLHGSLEALTERNAILVSEGSGGYIGILQRLTESQRLVDLLNKKANISDSEYLEIYSGRKSTRELLRRWGGLNKTADVKEEERRGLMILLSISLRADNALNQRAAIERIESIIGQKLS